MLTAPANAVRLKDEKIDDIGSLIKGYLIEGKPAFRLRETPTVAQAVEAIHEAGGVAIWAHPFWDIPDPDEVLATIDRFKALGIDGVEAFYVTHTQEQTELLAQALRGAGSAEHRLGRLPRAGEPVVLEVPCLRDVRLRAEPRTDRLRRPMACASRASIGALSSVARVPSTPHWAGLFIFFRPARSSSSTQLA